MLTPSDQHKLQKLLNDLPLKEEAFNIQALQGYLHAIAITPDVIVPSEWLPVIFGGEMPEYDTMQQAESMINAIMEGYNNYNALRMENRLHFPFEMDQLTPNMFDEIIDWAYGFHKGLRLRMDIWLSRIIARDLGEEEDPVANSVGVISALVHDDDENNDLIFDKIKNNIEDDIDEEEIKVRIVATLIRILPESINIIQEFGRVLDDKRQNKMQTERSMPVHSEKVGRNAPCPCGSGKKYKKCCGVTGNIVTLH